MRACAYSATFSAAGADGEADLAAGFAAAEGEAAGAWRDRGEAEDPGGAGADDLGSSFRDDVLAARAQVKRGGRDRPAGRRVDRLVAVEADLELLAGAEREGGAVLGLGGDDVGGREAVGSPESLQAARRVAARRKAVRKVLVH